MAGQRKRSVRRTKPTSAAGSGATGGRHARPSQPLFRAPKRLTTWQKATALVPLALLSGAWTTSLTMTGQSADAAQHVSRLPDGTPIPSHPLKKPASVTPPGSVAPAIPDGAAHTVAAQAATDGIPAVALAAYQHAAKVIDQADPGCRLPWQLLAAIGRVESDHGQYAGNVLGSDGVARPGIYGIPLDGSAGVADIADTDSGRYDGDPVYDRAVGPMQFIPSTWSVVGVDGDGDGVRNPQDINDAALGAAVYLCAGQGDLSTEAGRAAAVYRYNHNQDYVSLVLSIMRSYLDGEYTATPVQAAAPVTLGPAPKAGGKHRAAGPGQHATKPGGRHRARSGQKPSGGTAQQAGGATGGSTGAGQHSGGPTPSGSPSPAGVPTATVTATTGGVQETVIDMVQAVSMCTAELQDQYGAAPQDAVTKCANQIVGKTKADAQAAVSGVVSGLSDLVGGLLGGLTGQPADPPTGGSGGDGGLGGVLGGLGGGLGGVLGG